MSLANLYVCCGRFLTAKESSYNNLDDTAKTLPFLIALGRVNVNVIFGQFFCAGNV